MVADPPQRLTWGTARFRAMILAPVLQEVALRMNPGGGNMRDDRAAFAYTLRDAVQLVRPDWIVTHHDQALEADTVAGAGAEPDDVVDVDLTAGGPAAQALELTATLAGVFSGKTVAASITGPATMAVATAKAAGGDHELRGLAEDCGDILAALAAAHAERGAARIIVWEPETAGLDPDELAPAHEPIVRRLGLAGAEAVLCAASVIPVGYSAVAWPNHGEGAACLAGEAFSSPDALHAELARASEIAGAGGILLSDGPVPADADMTALRQLGER